MIDSVNPESEAGGATASAADLKKARRRKALTEVIVKATKSKAWAEALEKNGWTSALMTGTEFDNFVDDEFAGLRAIMAKSGMI